MDRRVALTVVAGALAALVLVIVTTSGEVRIWQEPSRALVTDAPLPPPDTSVPTTTTMVLAPATPGSAGSDLPQWLIIPLRIAFYLGLVLGLLALVRTVWRHRPELFWRARTSEGFVVDLLPDIPGAVVADAEAQRAVLRRGPPRNAIVACWLRLEDVVAAAGLARDPAETSAEFTTRVLASSALQPDAVLTLSSLFREARFSSHPMGEDQRDIAVSSLDTIHRELRVGHPELRADDRVTS